MKGIILILSCQSKMYKLSQIKFTHIGDMHRVNVIGGYDRNKLHYDEKLGFILELDCPDDYIFLLSKYIRAIKILYNLFSIDLGILRCCDDFKLTEQEIVKMFEQQEYCSKAIGQVFNLGGSNFYYTLKNRFSQLLDLYNLTYHNTLLPKSLYGQGDAIFLSNEHNIILLNHMHNKNSISTEIIEGRLTHPYICDDVAIGYILNSHNIYPKLF